MKYTCLSLSMFAFMSTVATEEWKQHRKVYRQEIVKKQQTRERFIQEKKATLRWYYNQQKLFSKNNQKNNRLPQAKL